MTQVNRGRRQDVGPRISASLRRVARRAAIVAALFLVSSIALGIVLLSPILLDQLGRFTTADWSRLSEIGQTYGAVSAVLAAIAVGGVAVSLLFQARQTRIAQLQVHRQYHLELMQMELDSLPLYLPCWGSLDVPTLRGKQQHIYTNLIMSFQWMSYDLRAGSQLDIRSALSTMFQGEVGRRYWRYARPYWVRWAERESRSRRFFRIVDEEYEKAVAAGPPAVLDEIEEVQGVQVGTSIQSERNWWIRATSVAFGGGLLIGIVLRRPRTAAAGGRPQGRP